MNDLMCVITNILCIVLYRHAIMADNATGINIQSLTSFDGNLNDEKESNKTSTIMFELDDFPSSCSQRQKQKTLCKHESSRLKKCCPIGESLSTNEENASGARCSSANIQLTINFVNVTLYDNCIEDMETKFTLPLEIGNPCNASILYNDIDDLFFIVQDGSLLVMDLYATGAFALYNNYCIDINNISGITYAIVCVAVEERIIRSQIVVVSLLMLISLPCLLLVVYLHLRIKELRSLDGIVLSCMSACLATGYFLYSLAHILKLDDRNTGYAVQFCMLWFYFWFFSLCCNVSVNICIRPEAILRTEP